MSRTYLYGIVEATRDVEVGVAGVDGASPVRIVACDGLGCVVSDCTAGDFKALPKEELIRRLLAHQRVAECVMERHHTVLPVRFGTILGSAQDALELLGQECPRLTQAVASIRDKIEIEVAATWDINQVLKEIAKEEEIVRTKEAMEHKGQPSLEERMRLGQAVKAYLDRRMASYRERMIGLLKPLSVDVAPNALVSDEMVMNVAFLLERSRQHNFDEQVRRLDEVFRGEILFRVIGPLPPYSFSTLEISRFTSQEVQTARQALHLGEATSEGEVKKAYRRLAAQEQQRPIPQDRSGQGHLARLREASEILLRYCQAQKEAWESMSYHDPAQERPRGLFSIAVRRTGSDQMEPTRFGGAVRVA